MEIKDFFRILIVDDSKAMRLHLKDIINKNDITPDVFEATNGKEAFLKCPSIKPDLVVIDLMMPKMSGLDAIRKLHALDPTMKIMVITSSTAKADTSDAIRGGASDVVIKPFNENQIAVKIVKSLRDKIKEDKVRLKKLEGTLKKLEIGTDDGQKYTPGNTEKQYLMELKKKSMGKI